MMGDEAPLPTPPKSIMGRLAQYAYSPNGKTASGFGSGSCSGPGSRVRATRDDGIVKIEHDNDDDVIFTGQSPAETIDVKPNVRRSINSDAENGAPVTPRKRAQADIKTEDEPELEAEDTVHTSPFLVRRAPSRRAKEASRRNYNVDDNGSDGSESEWDSGRSGRLKRRRTRASVNEAAAAAANEEEDAEVDELEDDPPKPEPSDENDGSTPRTPGRNGAAHGWRRPKAYADPVTGAYAHIPGLRDHLRPGLDVVFIGINPGQRSGARGHYFCHPTNKFQRALHQGGFTARLIAPEEDGSLLEVGVGLTNLVNRVTAQVGLCRGMWYGVETEADSLGCRAFAARAATWRRPACAQACGRGCAARRVLCR
jgi:hypothetical protein